MLQIEEILEKIDAVTTRYDNDSAVWIDKMETLQAFAQGDVQIQKIEDQDASDMKPLGTMQVVEGTTKGSRHVFEGDVVLFSRTGGPLDGPLAYLKNRSTLTHPEHRNVCLPEGWYSITYQRDFQREEIERVRD